MRTYPNSHKILEHNRRFIPGGVVSVNRAVEPSRLSSPKGWGHIWDVEGNHDIDYHAAFGPHLLDAMTRT